MSENLARVPGGRPITRYYLNLPAVRTRQDVEAFCERAGVVNTAGYLAVDGLRCMVEMPEVAIDGAANEARAIERRARALADTAERMRT